MSIKEKVIKLNKKAYMLKVKTEYMVLNLESVRVDLERENSYIAPDIEKAIDTIQDLVDRADEVTDLLLNEFHELIK